MNPHVQADEFIWCRWCELFYIDGGQIFTMLLRLGHLVGVAGPYWVQILF